MIEVVRHWVREHSPQAPHLEQTLAWTMELEPSASDFEEEEPAHGGA